MLKWRRKAGVATAHPYLHLESRRHDSRLRVSSTNSARCRGEGLEALHPQRWAPERRFGVNDSSGWLTWPFQSWEPLSAPPVLLWPCLCFNPVLRPMLKAASTHISSLCLSSNWWSCIPSPWKRASNEPKKETCPFSFYCFHLIMFQTHLYLL